MNKAKRILKDFNFEENGSRVDLVFKTQGGAANSYTTLVCKATNDLADSILDEEINTINPKGDPLVETINVEKAQYEQLEKNANEKEVAVAKAAQLETKVATLQEELNVIKAAKEASALEVVKAQLVGLVAEDKLEAIAKSLHDLGTESAQPIIDSMVAAKTAVEKSTLFVETTHADEVVVEKSAAEKSAETRAAYLAEQALKSI
jgi:ABC-type phosphate transport system auxiliary subunit